MGCLGRYNNLHKRGRPTFYWRRYYRHQMNANGSRITLAGVDAPSTKRESGRSRVGCSWLSECGLSIASLGVLPSYEQLSF